MIGPVFIRERSRKREMSEKNIAKGYTSAILTELENCLGEVDPQGIQEVLDAIGPDVRVFCDGAGRSRLQMQAFAMRLIQMGFDAKIVGEPTAPAITQKDLLFVSSASGQTPTLITHAQRAKEIGARVFLITASSDSELAKISDSRISLRASSKIQAGTESIQPMGSLFEQSVGILCDIIVLHLMDKYGITGAQMYEKHANLE